MPPLPLDNTTKPSKPPTGAGFFAVYLHPRILAVMCLGFSSGLPLALTFGTLSLWLAESGVSKTSIGLFALTGVPYTFKFLWAPLVDRLPIPGLTRIFGHRRGWALLTQFFLMLSISALGMTHPAIHPGWTAALALSTAFWSATQDIVIDAWRVEILEEEQYGAGAAMVVLGYRLGMLTSGAMALYLATFFGWTATYLIMAGGLFVGVATILLNPEPVRPISLESRELEQRLNLYFNANTKRSPMVQQWISWISGAVIGPFAEFVMRKGWLGILLFILCYKLGDALAGVMSNPFFVELGFSKIEIANISKMVGLIATLAGTLMGGWLVKRLGILKTLLICGLLQMISNLMFILLARAGHDLHMLTLTISLENLCSGMGTAAFVAYLSALCNVAYTATQYALLSSFMAFGRTILSSSGGWLADHMAWDIFFLLTTVSALPGLLLLRWLMKRFPGDKLTLR